MTLVPATVDEPTLVHGEALETLRQLPDGCVNLIATDPPYFRVKSDAWDRQWSTAAEFLAWMGELADEWRRVLAPNGSLYVFASPQMAARVECVIAERFNVLNSIVWCKPTGRHDGTCHETLRGYFPQTERIVFAEQHGCDAADGRLGYDSQCERLRFEVMAPLRSWLIAETALAGLSRRDINTAVGSTPSGGGMASHYVGDTAQWELPTEAHYDALRSYAAKVSVVPVFRRAYADLQAEYESLREQYESLRRPFSVTAFVPYTDVWTFPTVQAYPGKHPCEKPRAMMEHIIRASSRPGDVVLDCFLGSGVTGEAAVSLGRRFIGAELGDYIHGARRRIANAIGTPTAAQAANTVAPTGAQLGLL